MNSYQKLKEENKKLRQQLRLVCCNPESIEALLIKGDQQMYQHYENKILKGSHDLVQLGKVLDGSIKCNGIVGQITKTP